MSVLLRHVTLFFAFTQPPSTVSLSRAPPSDEYTVDGAIRSTSGRIIHGLGAVALGGIKTLAISKKLRIIDGFFPHTDDVRGSNTEAIYSDVLELSRSVR